jgi:phasin family protein
MKREIVQFEYAALQHTPYRDAQSRPCITTLEYFMLTPEQILASHKSNVETLFGLTAKAFEGVEKLVELNLAASKAAMSESAAHTQSVLSVKDAQELLALQAALFQPLAEKTAAYSRHLYDIAAGTGAEFGKAYEAKAAQAQQAFSAVVENATKNAPAGTEGAVAVMKGAIASANNAFESVQKAVKQANDLAESNFTAMTNTALNAAKPAGNSRKK